MQTFIKRSRLPLVVGVIAAALIFSDSLIAPLFLPGSTGAVFAWMAFVSWTVFAVSPKADRLKSFPGYVIGFLAANSIVLIGNFIGQFTSFNIINITIGALFGVFIVNVIIMYFEYAKRFFLDSLLGIFVGISLTFSGAGIGLPPLDFKLLLLIIIYGALGHACAIAMGAYVKHLERADAATATDAATVAAQAPADSKGSD